MIEGQHIGEETYQVRVMSEPCGDYEVTLEESYFRKLTRGDILPEELIEESFRYLLDMDKIGDLATTFDLGMLGIQDPDYEKEMKLRIRVKSR